MQGFRSVVVNHAHPKAADLRCQATTTITKFCQGVGRERYDVSTSTRERKFGVKGSRQVWDMTDLGQEFRFDTLGELDIVTMVDVDYHLKNFNLFQDHPILLYTNRPNSLGARTIDGSYYFKDPYTMVENVNGGAAYESGVWDFSPDLIMINGWFSFTVYHCDKLLQPNTDNRYLVLLAPIVRVDLPYWCFRLLAHWAGVNLRQVTPIQRSRNVHVHGDYLMGRFNVSGVAKVSIKLTQANHCFSCNIDEALWDTLVQMKGVSKLFTVADVARICEAYTHKLTNADFAMIANALSVAKYMPGPTFQAYGNVQSDSLEQPKAVARVAAEPIVSSVAFAAADTISNERLCIAERIVGMRNTVNAPEKYLKYKEEFLKLLVPVPAIGTPLTLDQVKERQNKPMQRARQVREEIHTNKPDFAIKSFVKKELASKVTPAHNISTLPQSHTLELSRFAYALKYQCLMKHDFFMPGCTPKKVVARIRAYVAKVKAKGKVVKDSDYVKFDASMSEFLRGLEFDVYRRWVALTYLDELEKHLSNEVGKRARGKHGTRYEQRFSRGSGSPLTTEGNTIVNAYLAYCAYRKAGLGEEEAFNAIGPKYGDDALDDSDAKLEEVAADLGLKVKVTPSGDQPVFLGRHYLDAVNYDTTYSNPIKVLQRVCVVLRNDDRALQDKINGFLITESHVPLVSNYLKAVKRIYKLRDGFSNDVEHDVSFRVHQGGYPVDDSVVADFLLRDAIAKHLDLTGVELESICTALDHAQTIDDLINIKINVKSSEIPKFKFFLIDSRQEVGLENQPVIQRIKNNGKSTRNRKQQLWTVKNREGLVASSDRSFSR
jgi:hypothetical protein